MRKAKLNTCILQIRNDLTEAYLIPVTGRVVETAEVKMMAGGTVAAIIAALILVV